MEILIMNDGTEVNGHILPNGDGITIFVYLNDKTVIEGVLLFSDRQKSKKVTAMYHGSEKVYEGYTEVYSASHEFGNCNLVMRKAGFSDDT